MNDEVADFLEHVGVKGMKWGVRKSRLVAPASSNKPKMSNDAKRAEYAKNKLKKGGVKALSDKEIVALQKRLNLEKKLSEVAPKKANAEVKSFVAGMGSTIVKGAIVSVATQQVSSALKKTATSTAAKTAAKNAAKTAAKGAAKGATRTASTAIALRS